MTIVCQKIDVEKISNQIIEVFFEPFRLLCHLFKSDKKKKNKHDTASVFSSVIRYILDDPIFF
jgi:hypothetical protein